MANRVPPGGAAQAGSAANAQQQPRGANPATTTTAPGATRTLTPGVTGATPAGVYGGAGAGPNDGAAQVVNNTPQTLAASHPGLTPGRPGVHGNAGSK